MQRRELLIGLPLLIGGCGGLGVTGRPTSVAELMSQQTMRMPNVDDMMAQQSLMQELMESPDLPGWHATREKMALAVGDRTFNRSFDRVFDSMTIALATLGSRVNNMERVSGYITASVPDLGPAKTQALQREGLRQYAAAKGYPSGIVDKKNDSFGIDVGSTTGMMGRGMAGLTLSLVRQGQKQTKVKLRFDNVFYPELVSEYYKTVWAAVDKQMFLDQALD
jgi:hypothetical protein